MRITWWPAHCLYWAFNAFPSLPQSSLFKILPTSAASQGRPSCLPCDLQLWFFLLHFLPVVFQSNTKISLGQDQAWIYSRDCLCQFCIWVRFPCLALLRSSCTSSYSCCLIPYCPFLFPFWVLAIFVASHLWWAKSLLERWVHISAAIFLGVQSWQLSPKSLGDPF